MNPSHPKPWNTLAAPPNPPPYSNENTQIPQKSPMIPLLFQDCQEAACKIIESLNTLDNRLTYISNQDSPELAGVPAIERDESCEAAMFLRNHRQQLMFIAAKIQRMTSGLEI